MSEPMSRHFHVPAREMLFLEREACPVYPPLGFEGVAVTPALEHYVVLTLLPGVRSYLGPTQVLAERQTEILVAALMTGPLREDHDVARAAGQWVLLAREAMLDGVVDAIMGDGPLTVPAGW